MKSRHWWSAILPASALLLAALTQLSCGGTDSITDTPADVARIEMAAPRQALAVGDSVQLSATPYSAEGNPMGARQVTFTSDHPEILAVNGAGLARGVSKGSATITAASGGASASLAFTVSRAPAVGLSSGTIAFSAVVPGTDPTSQTVQVTNAGDGTLSGLTTRITYAAGQPQGWLSAQLGGSTAPTTLTLTAARGTLSLGTYQATVVVSASGGSSQSLPVTFSITAAAVATVRVQPDTATLAVGAARTLQATTLDAAGNTLTGRIITWSSSDTTVAVVTGQGASATVTGRGSGQATITATSEGRSGTATVRVPAFALTVVATGAGTGTVTSSPAGISCTLSGGATTGTCRQSFAAGAVVTLTGTPTGASRFSGFSGACTGSTCQVTIGRDTTVTASFAGPLPRYTIATSSNPAAGGTTTGGGTVDSAASVTVKATAAAGYTFSGWTEGTTTVSTQASYTFLATSNRTLVANFAVIPPTMRALTVSGSGTGTGTVTSSPAGISCTITAGVTSGTCQATFTDSTAVTLTAAGSGGSTFSGFSGACTGTTCQVVMTQDGAVTAAFTAPVAQYTITTSSSPSNGGTTSGGGTFAAGTSVTVTATPAAGFTFASWTQDTTTVSTQASYTFTASANRSLVAHFNAIPPTLRTLAVSATGLGSGTVTSSPAGISCTIAAGTGSGTCSATFTDSTLVSLSAAPAAGSTFTGFSGACTGTTCSLNMTQDRAVTAAFGLAVRRYTITTSSNPAAGGTTTGGGTVDSATSVTVTATPAAGYTFGSWTEGTTTVSTQASYTFTATANRTLVANFIAQRTLAVSAAGLGAGTVTSSPAGISCTIAAGSGTGTCSATFRDSTVVTLSAVAAAGSTFAGFSGACSGTTCSLTMTQDRAVTAAFGLAVRHYTITTSSNPAAGGTTTGGGTVDSATSVTVTATPAAGYAFASWTEGTTTVSTQASYTFTATANRTLVANFIAQRTLSLGIGGTGAGTVTVNGQSFHYTGTAINQSLTFPAGTTMTLQAVPDTGLYFFSGWTGGCSGLAGCSFVLSNNTTVGATFSRTTVSLTASADTVCNAGKTCVHPKSLTLTATARGDTGASMVFTTTSGLQLGSTSTFTLTHDASGIALYTYSVNVNAGTLATGTYTVVASTSAGSDTVKSNADTFVVDTR